MRDNRVDYIRWLTAPILAGRRRAPFWLLVAVTGSGTLAMHILIPVLPLVAQELAVSPGKIQLTITLYLFGIAGGQLLYGPVSDRFGRRPTLLAGALCTLVVGFFPTHPALTAASVLLAGLLLGQCCFLLATRARPEVDT